MTEQQENGLPKYAKNCLRQLRMHLSETREAIRRFSTQAEGPDTTTIEPYSDNKIVLPGDTRVSLKTGRHEFHVRIEDGVLKIYSTNSVHLSAQASNMFTIIPVDTARHGRV